MYIHKGIYYFNTGLFFLTSQLRKAVMDHVSDSFLETNVPLLVLIEAAKNGNEKEVKEYAQVFREHANKLIEVMSDFQFFLSQNLCDPNTPHFLFLILVPLVMGILTWFILHISFHPASTFTLCGSPIRDSLVKQLQDYKASKNNNLDFFFFCSSFFSPLMKTKP